MSTSYDALLTYIMSDVRGVVYDTAIRAIRDAVIEFCAKSNAWRYEHPEDSLSPDNEYTFQPPSGAIVSTILGCWVDSSPIEPKSHEELRYLLDNWITARGSPQFVTQFNERSYRLVPYPTTSNAEVITLLVALKPTRSSTSFDTTIFEEWAEGLANGARARLMAMRGQPWTDVEGATLERRSFDNHIKRARIRAEKGFSRASNSVQPREFV